MTKKMLQWKNINKYNIFLIILILIIAFIPRSIELFNKNYLWGHDQGLFYQAVKEIVINRKPTLIGAEVGGGGFFQGPGWYYFLAIPFFLFRGDPYGGMILMLFLGVATVFFAFYLGQKMYGRSAGFFIGSLIAISPGIIAQSRFIWPPFPVSLITVFLIYYFYRFFRGGKHYFPLITFLIGIISHFEIAVAGTLLIQVLFLVPFFFWKKLISFKTLLLSIGTFLLTLSSLIIFDIRHDFINTKGVINLFLPKEHADAGSQSLLSLLNNHYQVFRLNLLSTFYWSELLVIPIILFFIVGTFIYLRNKKNNYSDSMFVGYLFLSPLLLFVAFFLYKKPIWEWWLIELPIFYCFLFGILLSFFWKLKHTKIFVGIFAVTLGSAFIMHTVSFYRHDYNDFGGVHKIKGKLQAIDFIYRDAKDEKFNLLVFTPPVYTDAYDYLLWWHGREKYGYVPKQENKSTFYLLIEPDPHKPWSYNGWLETVIKTGKIIKTKTLQSGFIIQKRIATNEKSN